MPEHSTTITIEEEVLFEKLVGGDSEAFNSSIPDNEYFQEVYLNIRKMQRLEYNTSCRSIGGQNSKLILLLKKILCRLMLFYVEPVCQQQTLFNSAVTQASVNIRKINFSLAKQNQMLLEKQETLQKEYEETKEAMECRLCDLEIKIQKLEQSSGVITEEM